MSTSRALSSGLFLSRTQSATQRLILLNLSIRAVTLGASCVFLFLCHTCPEDQRWVRWIQKGDYPVAELSAFNFHPHLILNFGDCESHHWWLCLFQEVKSTRIILALMFHSFFRRLFECEMHPPTATETFLRKISFSLFEMCFGNDGWQARLSRDFFTLLALPSSAHAVTKPRILFAPR